MSINENEYFRIRAELLQNKQRLVDIERRYMGTLLKIVQSAAPYIQRDFERPTDLLPFWINYPPRQRGRAASGRAVPWGDMGEKAVSGNFGRALVDYFPSVTYPGLPGGSDIRFATDEALIHFDFKLTGPNDRDDEVVASPNQISGDGAHWQDGAVRNSVHEVVGTRGGRGYFEPTLPPFYTLEGNVLICLTFFLEVVYTVRSFGDQPLQHLELVCVPNGLLMFDGPAYAHNIRGLVIPGKDDKTKLEGKRVRVRLEPLVQQISSWRSIYLEAASGWEATDKY